MSTVLTALNAYLTHVLADLNSPSTRSEICSKLHNHNKGALPDRELSQLADRSIDLLHEIEQKLEPGHLVLADHFLGA